MNGKVRRVMSLVLAVLREIFDESAYERFLFRQALDSSPRAYAIFLRENAETRSRRPRCC
jgi:hypothetical protein